MFTDVDGVREVQDHKGMCPKSVNLFPGVLMPSSLSVCVHKVGKLS